MKLSKGLHRLYYRFFEICDELILRIFYLYTNHKVKCRIKAKAKKTNSNVPWCALCQYNIQKCGWCEYVSDGSKCWDCDINPPDIDDTYGCLFSELHSLLFEYVNRNNDEYKRND